MFELRQMLTSISHVLRGKDLPKILRDQARRRAEVDDSPLCARAYLTFSSSPSRVKRGRDDQTSGARGGPEDRRGELDYVVGQWNEAEE